MYCLCVLVRNATFEETMALMDCVGSTIHDALQSPASSATEFDSGMHTQPCILQRPFKGSESIRADKGPDCDSL